MASKEVNIKRMGEILRRLECAYPDAECSLFYKTPFQLLIATILSAQCTDERVNKVTPSLFAKWSTPLDFAKAKRADIEKVIQSTGFFRSKAQSIQEASQALVVNHNGKVPEDLEELVKLRGVGRKTANVVRGVAFKIPSLVVDTHVGRISRRMGFTRSTDPVKVEHEMADIVPREKWSEYAHLLIQHGRAICTARKALCEECTIASLCPKVGWG
ncbi:MAG: endonuclease III [Bdellovibrionota bacterium]